MTRPPAASVHAVIAPIASVARLLLTEDTSTEQDAGPVTIAIPVDLEPALIETAVVVLGELGVMQRLSRRAEAHPQVVAGIVNLAEAYGTSSPSAIGVIGALVDRMREPDEEEIARLLARAIGTVPNDDLFHGAAALLAAATSYLADMLGERPVDVHDEIHSPPDSDRSASA